MRKLHTSDAVVVRSTPVWILGTLAILLPVIGYPVASLHQRPGLPRMALEGRLVGAVIAAVVLMVFWHAGRLRAEATPQGVTVFGYMRKIVLPWGAVEDLTLRGSLRIQVRGGRSVTVPGFKPGPAQAAAGNRPGRKALAELAACRRAGISDPAADVAVKYEPYVNVWLFAGALLVFVAIAFI